MNQLNEVLENIEDDLSKDLLEVYNEEPSSEMHDAGLSDIIRLKATK